MNMILINPYLQTIDKMRWIADEWDYTEVYKLINCETFDWVELDPRGNGMYVDDNGLLELKLDTNGELEQQFFQIRDNRGHKHTIAGAALVLGTDKMTGETKGTDLDVDYIKSQLDFVDKKDNNKIKGE